MLTTRISTPRFITIRKIILKNFQNSQKYRERCKTTFIFVGSYFAERLWEKVRFLKVGTLSHKYVQKN